MARLPSPGGDDNQWGDILNDFLAQEHNPDGTQKPLPQNKITNLTADLSTITTDLATKLNTTDPKVTADQAPGTASIRTLGYGTNQAAQGSDVDGRLGALENGQPAAAQSARDQMLFQGLSPIVSRSRIAGSLYTGAPGLSDGVLTGQTSALSHKFLANCAELRVGYCNTNGGTPGPNDITVRGALSLAAGSAPYQVTFAGRSSAVISPDGLVISDPIGLDAKKSTYLFSRTYVSVDAGLKWPNGHLTGPVGDGRWDNSDTTLLAGTSGINNTAGVPVYGPAFIIGYGKDGEPAIMLYGDSIILGSGDTPSAEASYDQGWAARSLNNLHPYIQAGSYGSAASGFSPFLRRNVGKYFGTCAYAVCAHGRNDVTNGRTQAQIQADLTAEWLAFYRRSVIARQATITPLTTSTDSWTTTVNQTVSNAGQEAVRVAVNTWLRDGAPMDGSYAAAVVGSAAAGTLRAGDSGHPLVGILEVADVVETARNSGIWKANYCADGVHPKAAGHIAIAAALNLSTIFTA